MNWFPTVPPLYDGLIYYWSTISADRLALYSARSALSDAFSRCRRSLSCSSAWMRSARDRSVLLRDEDADEQRPSRESSSHSGRSSTTNRPAIRRLTVDATGDAGHRSDDDGAEVGASDSGRLETTNLPAMTDDADGDACRDMRREGGGDGDRQGAEDGIIIHRTGRAGDVRQWPSRECVCVCVCGWVRVLLPARRVFAQSRHKPTQAPPCGCRIAKRYNAISGTASAPVGSPQSARPRKNSRRK